MLCIVDNSLKNFVGHPFEYSRCLYECAARRGDPILILGHRAAEAGIKDAFPFEPVFRRSSYDLLTRVPVLRDMVNPTVQNYLFFRDLKRALEGKYARDWILFTPTMTHNHIWAWAAWLQTVPPEKCPTVVLFVRNTYCFSANTRRYDKRAYFALPAFKWLERLAAEGRRIHLVTDSHRLAREYAGITRLPMPVLPTPHTDRTPSAAAKPGPSPRFVWLGGLRKDKGFLVFARAVLALEAELRSGCIEFVIQSNLDDPKDGETRSARESIKTARLPGVTLMEAALTGQEYTDLLISASVVVMPRLLQLYRSQTSGPFVEALAAGKPVIVTAGSWMSDQLERHGAGMSFKDEDAEDLANAIRALARNYPDFKTRAEHSAKEWMSIHNPDRLYEMLVNAPEGIQGL